MLFEKLSYDLVRLLCSTLLVTFSRGIATETEKGRRRKDSETPTVVGSIADEAANVLAFAPDNRTLVSGSTDDLRLWLLRTGKQLSEVENSADAVESCRYLTFSPDGKMLASVH